MSLNNIGDEGAAKLAEVLNVNTGLQHLKWVPHLNPNLAQICQQPRTIFLKLLSYSLDGHPLKIKELRGEEPVESIDLSNKGLGVASAVVIASLLVSNTTTKSLRCAI